MLITPPPPQQYELDNVCISFFGPTMQRECNFVLSATHDSWVLKMNPLQIKKYFQNVAIIRVVWFTCVSLYFD